MSVRAWASRAGMVALLVIAVQTGWRAVLLGRGFFSQDDFLVMAGTQHGGWASVLGGDYAGSFSPGGTALAWASVSTAPLAWPLAAATVLILQAGATALLWLVLTRLLGDRWLRVPLLVLFAFSPLTLWSTQWWVLGLEFWGGAVLVLAALWAVLACCARPDRRLAAGAVLAFALAVLFDDRAVLAPLLFLGVAAMVAEAPTVRGRLAAAGRALAPVWIGVAVVLVGYAVLRWQAAPLESVVGDELGDVVTGYLRQGLAEAFGGPWRGGRLPAHAYLVPLSWAVAANGALLLALIGSTLQRGGAGTRISWALLVVYTAGSVALLAFAGRGELIGSLGLVHRYAAELALVLTLCAAGALREVTLPDLTALGRAYAGPRIEGLASAAAALALVVSAAVSTAFLAPNLYHRDDRAYVEHLRAALRADRQAVLLDAGVPAGILSPWYAERATVSRVIGYAPESPVFDLPSHVLRIVRDDGTLAPVVLDGPVAAAASDDEACPYAVRDDGIEVPMAAQVPSGRWVLRIGYYTSAEGFATVEVAGGTQRFAVRTGLQAVQLVVDGAFDRFRITLSVPGQTLCLTDAEAGVPKPAAP